MVDLQQPIFEQSSGLEADGPELHDPASLYSGTGTPFFHIRASAKEGNSKDRLIY